MTITTSYLILGSCSSLILAALHLILVFKPQGWVYFGAGDLTKLAEQDAKWVIPVTAVLALLFAVWGLYGLAGAEVISPLPFLTVVLQIIGIIYLLRGLMLPSDLIKTVMKRYPVRFAFFSSVSLVTGLFYLVGTGSLPIP
ncbi:MAG: hypothetical protein R3E39_23015 [Anaerolineae bacterium]